MKSNPFIFPFRKFSKLNGEMLPGRIRFGQDMRISLKDLKFLEGNDLAHIHPTGKTAAERITSIFLHPDVRFGPKKFITANRGFFRARLNFFIRDGKPINFEIMGFPCKVPVPLKTNRTLPDMGDLMALRRLNNLLRQVRAAYPPGGKLHIITEGMLCEFLRIPQKDIVGYERELKRLARLTGLDKYLIFLPLARIKKERAFGSMHQKKTKRFMSLLASGDPLTLRKYRRTFPSIFHLLNVRSMKKEEVVRVYKNEPGNTRLRRLRKRLESEAIEVMARYFAVLECRDELNFVEKNVPGYVGLTVSPKSKRFGIHLINRDNEILPHHGVPVNNHIEYLVDVESRAARLARIFLKEDKEKRLPFCYFDPTNK